MHHTRQGCVNSAILTETPDHRSALFTGRFKSCLQTGVQADISHSLFHLASDRFCRSRAVQHLPGNAGNEISPGQGGGIVVGDSGLRLHRFEEPIAVFTVQEDQGRNAGGAGKIV